MEKFTIAKDMSLLYVQAAAFPSGIGKAFADLKAALPAGSTRTLYGISKPDGINGIVYRAAAEEMYPGEGNKLGCETFLIKSGEYISEYLVNWKADESIIGKAFHQLLTHPDIDPTGYCLEIYENDLNVRCLVPLS